MRSEGTAEAVRVDDGAVTFSVSVPVTAAVPVTFMASGLGEQVTPGGNAAAGQVTLTVPVNPPVGVTVLADVPLAPAVAVTALPLMVKAPEGVTVTLIAVAREVAQRVAQL